MKKFNFFKPPIGNTTPNGEWTIEDVFSYVVKNDDAKHHTKQLRSIEDKDGRKKYKLRHFDFVTFSGTFKHRCNKGLINHSGYLAIDIDNVGAEQAIELKKRIIGDKVLLPELVFISPTGKGLKVVIEINLGWGCHLEWFYAAKAYYKGTYGIEIDEQCKDVGRACFLPHDKDCYIRTKNETSIMNFDAFKQLAAEGRGKADAQEKAASGKTTATADVIEKVEQLIRNIEQQKVDITSTYKSWIGCGFALKDAFGEDGRKLFHRISRFYPKYDAKKTDKKWNSLMASSNQGIHINTLFHYAKKAGVWSNDDKTCANCASTSQKTENEISSINCANYLFDSVLNKMENKISIIDYTGKPAQNAQEGISTFSVTFSDRIPLENWPQWFRPIVTCTDEPGHQDKLILPSIVQIGAIISSNIYGVYNGQKIYPNLMLIQYCPPAVARKGEVKETYLLTEKTDQELEENYGLLHAQWDKENEDWIEMGKRANERKNRGLRPVEPIKKTFDIAANSTEAAMYKQLEANNGLGIIRATEGSLLESSLKSTYGGWLELLLEGFQNEPSKKSVLKDNTNIRIPVNKIAVALTCPPEITEELFKKYINTGLISRFLIQQLPSCELKPRDVFAKKNFLLCDIFRNIGNTAVYNLYKEMEKMGSREIQFMFSPEQEKDFMKTLNAEFDDNTKIYGISFAEFQFRLFLMCFKIAMTLCVMREYQEAKNKECIFDENTQAIVCKQEDYEIAKTIILQMSRHTLHVYSLLHNQMTTSYLMLNYKLNAEQARLYEAMPDHFTTKDVQNWCKTNNMNYQTVRRWILNFSDHKLICKSDKLGAYYKNA